MKPEASAPAQTYEVLDPEYWDAVYEADAALDSNSEYLMTFATLAPFVLPLLPAPPGATTIPAPAPAPPLPPGQMLVLDLNAAAIQARIRCRQQQARYVTQRRAAGLWPWCEAALGPSRQQARRPF